MLLLLKVTYRIIFRSWYFVLLQNYSEVEMSQKSYLLKLIYIVLWKEGKFRTYERDGGIVRTRKTLKSDGIEIPSKNSISPEMYSGDRRRQCWSFSFRTKHYILFNLALAHDCGRFFCLLSCSRNIREKSEFFKLSHFICLILYSVFKPRVKT